MKLKNKKTGEIVIADITHMVSGVRFDCSQSLAELNEEWEDYEEPENFYIVEQRGTVGSRFRTSDEYEKMFKEIGNYFETREEAEKAVEKLKAWKRLKDKGFDIEGWDNHIGDNYYKTGQIVISLNNVKNRDWDEYDNIGEIKEELDLLFGGEE